MAEEEDRRHEEINWHDADLERAAKGINLFMSYLYLIAYVHLILFIG